MCAQRRDAMGAAMKARIGREEKSTEVLEQQTSRSVSLLHAATATTTTAPTAPKTKAASPKVWAHRSSSRMIPSTRNMSSTSTNRVNAPHNHCERLSTLFLSPKTTPTHFRLMTVLMSTLVLIAVSISGVHSKPISGGSVGGHSASSASESFTDHLLTQLIRNRHVGAGQQMSPFAIADPEEAFDPSSDSILGALEVQRPEQQLRIQTPVNVDSRPKSALIFAKHHKHHPKPETEDAQQDSQSSSKQPEMGDDENSSETEISDPIDTNDSDAEAEIRAAARWLTSDGRQHLTLHEAHALVKSVINNRLIEQLDNKTLEHLTQKYGNDMSTMAVSDREDDLFDLHSATVGHQKQQKAAGSSRPSSAYEHSLGPEEFLDGKAQDLSFSSGLDDITLASLPDIYSSEKSQNSQVKDRPLIDPEFMKHYENLEQIMQILMHSENTLKKRGEGPHLSIDSALTVLRERLLLELARRKAKATQDQIAINSEILKKLGRRRRRSVETPHQRRGASSSRRSKLFQQSLDCEERDCRVEDLNRVWSNLHTILYSLAAKNRPTIDGSSYRIRGGGHGPSAMFMERTSAAPTATTPGALPATQSSASSLGHYNNGWAKLRPYRLRNNDKFFATFNKNKSSTNVSTPENSGAGHNSTAMGASVSTQSNKLLNRLNYYLNDQRIRLNSRAPRL